MNIIILHSVLNLLSILYHHPPTLLLVVSHGLIRSFILHTTHLRHGGLHHGWIHASTATTTAHHILHHTEHTWWWLNIEICFSNFGAIALHHLRFGCHHEIQFSLEGTHQPRKERSRASILLSNQQHHGTENQMRRSLAIILLHITLGQFINSPFFNLIHVRTKENRRIADILHGQEQQERTCEEGIAGGWWTGMTIGQLGLGGFVHCFQPRDNLSRLFCQCHGLDSIGHDTDAIFFFRRGHEPRLRTEQLQELGMTKANRAQISRPTDAFAQEFALQTQQSIRFRIIDGKVLDGRFMSRMEFRNAIQPRGRGFRMSFAQDIDQQMQQLTRNTDTFLLKQRERCLIRQCSAFIEFSQRDGFADLTLGQLQAFVGRGFVVRSIQ
mmetsp:Transcript_11999/g.19905  ORF Transcript_11999/g.19905 Transcript_11999/m.19905 type:complete len:383 (+) Transcript_11999:77-1225(+)